MTDTINDVAAEAAAQEEPAVPALDERGVAEQLVAQAREKGIELVGPNGLLSQLTKRVLEAALEAAEMSEHLGYEKHDPVGRNHGNSRNGVRSKTVLTEIGPVEIEVPRDLDASFQPTIVKKRQRRLTGVDQIVLSLSARGLTTGEISAHFAEVYGASVPRETVSKITDQVLEEMGAWMSRPLDEVYPVIFIDAIVVKVRDGQVRNKPIYVVIGVTVNGERDILGLWLGDGGEGAKFWLQVLAELKNRGVADVCIAVCDGLKGLPDAINTVWELTTVQACIIRLIRNTFRYASRKYWDQIAHDLRPLYTAANEAEAWARFEEFAEKWGKPYPAIKRLWENAWAEFVPFLDYGGCAPQGQGNGATPTPSCRAHCPSHGSASTIECRYLHPAITFSNGLEGVWVSNAGQAPTGLAGSLALRIAKGEEPMDAQQQPRIVVSRRTLLQYLLGAAGVATLAAACSASTSGGGGGGGEGGSLTFMATQFNPVEERQKYEAVLKQYAPGVAFNPVEQGVFATTIKSQVAAGKVQVNFVGGLHGDLAPYSDQLEDLTSLAAELQDKGYAKDLLDLAKLGGTQTKYIPWILASYVVAVNKKALQWLPSGADVNNLTYEQYLAWAKAAKAANGGKAVFGMPAGPKGLHHRFYQGFLLPSFTGGQITTFMNDDAVTAWTYMKDLWQNTNPASTNYDFMQEPLARGEVLVAWDHVARLVGAVGDKPDEWTMVAAPSGPKGLGYLLVVGGMAIPKGAPEREKTIAAIKSLSTPEAQIATLKSNAFFPTVKAEPPTDLPPAIAMEAKAVAAQQSAEDAILALPPVGLGAKDGEVGQLFKNCFQEICLNGADVKSTLQAQGKQLNAILAELKVPCWPPDPVQPGQVCQAV